VGVGMFEGFVCGVWCVCGGVCVLCVCNVCLCVLCLCVVCACVCVCGV